MSSAAGHEVRTSCQIRGVSEVASRKYRERLGFVVPTFSKSELGARKSYRRRVSGSWTMEHEVLADAVPSNLSMDAQRRFAAGGADRNAGSTQMLHPTTRGR